METLQSFAEAVDWARSGRFTQQDIDEAKLSVFASVDAPVAPSDRGTGHTWPLDRSQPPAGLPPPSWAGPGSALALPPASQEETARGGRGRSAV